MYYEVIYEDGFHSVANYDSDEQALSALGAHHERATKGELAYAGGDSQTPKAVRVVKVFVYDVHPDTYNEEQMLTDDELLKMVKEFSKDHPVVFVPEFIGELRSAIHPQKESGAHESNYKMPEARELELTWL